MNQTSNVKTKAIKWLGIIGAIVTSAVAVLNGDLVTAAGILSAALSSASVFSDK